MARDLTQCNVRNIGNRADRQLCRTEAILAANAELAEHDLSDRQADRNRINCISDCRRQLRECREPSGPTPLPSTGEEFTIDCEAVQGRPCRRAVADICERIAGPCDDCLHSLCGGGDWLIDSDLPLRSVTLVAVSDPFERGRVLATSSIKGKRAILSVPRDLKLNSGEQLYFQFSSRTKPRKALKVTIHRDR